MNRERPVLVLSHVTDLSGPTEALLSYLQRRSVAYVALCLPFYYCEDRRPRVIDWGPGRREQLRSLPSPRLREPTSIARDILVSGLLALWWSIRRRHFSVAIGCNPLNCLFALFLRATGIADRVVLYSIDWTPRRFESGVANRLYHTVDQFAARHADVCWNVSTAIQEERRRLGVADAVNLHVPIGTDVVPGADCSEQRYAQRLHRLALVGALAPSKGVDLVIDAFPRIRARFPDAELWVIGKTPPGAVENGIVFPPYEPRLQALGDGVSLFGVVPRSEVLRLLLDCGVGLAPFRPDDHSISARSDPSRVKDYVACGLPVVIGDVSPVARPIAEVGAGIACAYGVSTFAEAVSDLLDDRGRAWRQHLSALEYAASLSWDAVFDRAFRGVGQ